MDGARFAVFAPGVRSPATLDALAERMQESALEPIRVRDRQLLLSFSVGGSLFPLDGGDASVVRAADRAMQSVRKHGGNAYRRYGTELDAEYSELLSSKRTCAWLRSAASSRFTSNRRYISEPEH
jgi:hypothetical protein